MPVKVKICGIRTPEALQAALAARADFIGFVFYPPSPRSLAPEVAAELAELARGRATLVALIVDADDALIERIVQSVDPDMLQLHGSETPDRAAEIRRRFGKPIVKAIKVETAGDAVQALAFADVASLILFDAKAPKDLAGALPGGNGLAFDWHLIAGVKDRVPFMLSGGLTPETVGAAIAATGATTVDVSSGVETAPGIKSPDLIRRFIAAARAVHVPA
jgi:phosphoribosylanthranilate isomerase